MKDQNNNGILNKYIVNKDIKDELKIEEINKETNIPHQYNLWTLQITVGIKDFIHPPKVFIPLSKDFITPPPKVFISPLKFSSHSLKFLSNLLKFHPTQ